MILYRQLLSYNVSDTNKLSKPLHEASSNHLNSQLLNTVTKGATLRYRIQLETTESHSSSTRHSVNFTEDKPALSACKKMNFTEISKRNISIGLNCID